MLLLLVAADIVNSTADIVELSLSDKSETSHFSSFHFGSRLASQSLRRTKYSCHKPQGLCKGCISLSSAEGLSAAIVVMVALEPASYLADTRAIKKHLFGTYFPKKC